MIRLIFPSKTPLDPRLVPHDPGASFATIPAFPVATAHDAESGNYGLIPQEQFCPALELYGDQFWGIMVHDPSIQLSEDPTLCEPALQASKIGMDLAAMQCGTSEITYSPLPAADIKKCIFDGTGACMCLGPMPGDVQPNTDGGQFEYKANCDPAKLGLMKINPYSGGEVPDYAALPDD